MTQQRRFRIIEGEIQWWIFNTVIAGILLTVAISAALITYLLSLVRTTLSGLPPDRLEWFLNRAVDATAFAVMIEVLMISIAGFYALYASHRIAGPLYRIREDLREMAASGKSFPIHTRPNDKLVSLVATINQVLARVQERQIFK